MFIVELLEIGKPKYCPHYRSLFLVSLYAYESTCDICL